MVALRGTPHTKRHLPLQRDCRMRRVAREDMPTLTHGRPAGRMRLRGYRRSRVRALFMPGVGQVDESRTESEGPAELTTDVASVVGSVEVVEAENVTIRSGGATQVRAVQVDMSLSGAGSIYGDIVHLDQAAAILINAESAVLEDSTVAVVSADVVAAEGSRCGSADRQGYPGLKHPRCHPSCRQSARGR